nr:cadherin domain-containing protein [Kiloniellales bacterium]
DLALTGGSVAENSADGTSVASVAVTDPDVGDSASYALTDDAGGRFAIDSTTGEITVADGSLLDHEAAASHDITVRVTDGASNTYTETFSITVGDVNEAPTDLALTGGSVAENSADGTTVGSVAVTDPDVGDSASYALTDDAGGRFAIDSTTGEVTVADGSLLDHEAAASHDITVRVTDGASNTYTETFTVTVGDVNEAPTDLALTGGSVAENSADGTTVGSVAVTDPDAADSASYALTDDAGGRFAIDAATGEITVADGSLLDHEAAASHDVTVRVTDGGGLTYTETFSITVGDVNEAPTDLALTGSSVAENSADGTPVGSVSVTDPDVGDSASYALTDDAGGRFAIDSTTGEITVADGSLLDHEAAASHDVTVRVTDGASNTYTETFSISVGDVNEAPTDLALTGGSVAENSADGTTVGSVAVTDPDVGDSASYALTDDAGGRFAIDSTTGEITVADGSLLDHEAAAAHDITVRVTDGASNTYTETFTVTVGDVNEAPTDLALTGSSVAENSADGTPVGSVAVTDPDVGDSASYALTDDAGGRFTIDSTTGEITVADGSLLDHEAAANHDITVRVTDGASNTYTETFSISVGDINEAPTDILFGTSVDENAADGTVVDVAIGVDPDAGDSMTYALTDDAGGRFAIDSSTGQVTVADGNLLDHEAAAAHDITVRVTDSGGLTYTETFTITVNDVNEAPTDLALTGGSVAENSADGTTVGSVAVTDPDAADSASYALTDDAGGRFAIDSTTGEVTVADGSLLDHEAAAAHDITVRVTDGASNTYTETFTISVGDVNEAPTDLALTGGSVAENSADGTSVASVAVTDPDVGDSASYALTDDAGGRFAIDSSTGQVTVADGSLLDHEAAASHDVTVRVTDGASNTYTEAFSISIGDINEAPTVVTADVTGDEDTGIPLSITLGNLEPGAAQSVLISGVPSGAMLSAGTDNGDGTWTLTPGQTSGLTITPPLHSDADFQLTVTASSDDGSTVETSGPQTIDVTVDPVADTPNLTVTSTASGTEDGSAQVNIPASILALDGNPGLVVTVSNVPSGATLSAGTDNGDGTWTLGSGELANLIVEPPAGDASSFTLDFSATAPVQENPVNEGFGSDAGGFTYADDSFRGTSAPSYADGGWSAGAGQSGGGLSMILGGIDNADINGMSGGFSTSFTVTESSSGTVTFSYRMIQTDPYESNEFSQVLASLDGTLIGQGGNDYITQLNGGGDTGWQTATLDLGTLAPGTYTLTLGGYNNLKTYNDETTEIRFDNVDLTLDTTTTVIGSDIIDPDFVELDIASSLVDTDGSESLTVVISGVPTGAALSAGTNNGDGSWTVDPADLPGLTLFPPEDFGGSFQLTVTATATDGSDTADAVQTIDVTVSYLNEPPVSNDSTVSTDEDTTVTFGLSDFGYSDAEGDAIVEVEVSTLPSEGSLLLNGVAVGAGDRIAAADINAGNLTFQPAADSDADPSFTFRVSDGGHFSSAPATMSITVDAVADAPALTVTDAVADNSVFQSTFEIGASGSGFDPGTVDGWSPSAGHQIEFWHENDVAGSAADGDMFIEINNQSAGSFPDAGSIERTISTTMDTPYELSFQVSPRPGFESYMDFQVRVVDVSTGTTLKTLAVDWDGNTVSQLTWTGYSVSFLGTGGDIQLIMEDVGAVHPYGRGAYVDDIQLAESSGTAAGDPIDLSSLISVVLTDTDGSESLDPIEIAGIPEGFLLESGGSPVTVIDGVAEVTPAELADLTMTSPEGFAGNVDLSVTATSTEAANGDSATTTDTLTIDIVANDENLDSLGLSSNDILSGDAGDNTIYGGAGDDTLSGNAGADTLFGGSSDDILNGGSGADVLLGGDGDDSLNGGLDNDLLQGGAGDDSLDGGSGVDSIFGGEGNDTLDGGASNDRLYGEGGSDLFIFAEGNGNDLVSGGQGGWTDVIQLENASGGTPTAGWTYVIDQGTVESSGADFLDLSEDAAGTITLADGSEVTFEGIERIEW